MKKNLVTKILLAMVALALVFALASCSLFGGKNDDKKTDDTQQEQSGKALTAPTVTINGTTAQWAKVKNAKSYTYTIYDENGDEVETKTVEAKNTSIKVELKEGQSITVIAKADGYTDSPASARVTAALNPLAQIKNVIGGASTLVDIINGIGDTINAEVSLGGYFRSGESKNSAALKVMANANKTSPEVALGLTVNEGEPLFSIGYTGNKLLVNTGDKVYVDLTALDGAENALMAYVMGLLADIPEIQFSSIADTVNGVLDSPMLSSMGDISSLIDIQTLDDGSVSIGLTCGTLDTLLNVLPMLLKDVDIDALATQYLDMVPSLAKNETVLSILPGLANVDLSWISWNSIKDKITAKKDSTDSLLKVVVKYGKEGSLKVINGIDVVIDLSALDKDNLNYEVGLSVGLMLSTTTKAKVAEFVGTGYKAKEIELDLDADLGLKDISATGKAVVRLSDMLSKKDAVAAYATIDVTKGATTKTVKGFASANGLYADFSGLFELFGVTGETTQYKVEYPIGNLVDFVEDAVKGLGAKNAALEIAGLDIGGLVDMGKGIVDGLIEVATSEKEMSEKIVDVCSYVYKAVYDVVVELVPSFPNEEALVDKIAALEITEGVTVQNYSKITIDGKIGDIVNAFIDKHKANAETLKAAVNAGEGKAGVQLIGDGNEVKGILDYVAAFVKIPTVNQGALDFTTTADINDATALKAWLNFALGEAKVSVFDDMPVLDMLEDIIGKSLDEIIDGGLYFEVAGELTAEKLAKYGLSGSLTAKESVEGDEYASASAGIYFQNATTAMSAFDGSAFTAFNAKEEETYKIAEAFIALFNAAFVD